MPPVVLVPSGGSKDCFVYGVGVLLMTCRPAARDIAHHCSSLPNAVQGCNLSSHANVALFHMAASISEKVKQGVTRHV